MLQREWSRARVCVCVCVRASYGLVGVGSWSPARKAESWGFTFHSGCLLLSLEINEPRVEVFFFFKILFVYYCTAGLCVTITGLWVSESLDFDASLLQESCSVLVWMELWLWWCLSVSMKLNGSHVEITRRGGQKKLCPPPLSQQRNSDLYSDNGPVETHVSLPEIDKWLTWSLKMGVREWWLC